MNLRLVTRRLRRRVWRYRLVDVTSPASASAYVIPILTQMLLDDFDDAGASRLTFLV
jgi:hypothetical protein